MEDKAYVQFKCYIHELSLDGTWQCPDRRCRAAHCPLCGRYEKDRCEHLFYTQGEWVYYAPDGVSSEDLPTAPFEEFDLDLLVEAFAGDRALAARLWEGEDPLRVLCVLAIERSKTPVLESRAGGWQPGSDAWCNIWVSDMPAVLVQFGQLVQLYQKGRLLLDDEPEGEL